MRKLLLCLLLVFSCSLFAEPKTWSEPSSGLTWVYQELSDGTIAIVHRLDPATSSLGFGYDGYYRAVSSSDKTVFPAEGRNFRINVNKLPETVTVPAKIDGKSVSSIGPYVFTPYDDLQDNPTTLKAVIVPEGVTSIDMSAFFRCVQLESISLPASLKHVKTNYTKNSDFYFPNLKKITVSPKNKNFKVINGFLYSSKEKSVVLGVKNLKSLKIPKGVKKINDLAFCGSKGLISVVIPDSVTKIGKSAFEGCTGLTSVTIPSSVTSIGGGAFFGCSGLTSVTISSSVASIGDYAFGSCSNVTSVELPAHLEKEKVGDSAFTRCSPVKLVAPFVPWGMNVDKLEEIVVPEGVTEIKDAAFSRCQNVASLLLPKTIVKVGDRAFSLSVTRKLTAPYVPRGLAREKITDVVVLEGVTKIKTLAFADCRNLTSITLPEGVTAIEERAFQNCSSLTSIVLPSTLTTIDKNAFQGCTSLTSITLPEGVTSLGDAAFLKCSSLTTVVLPSTLTAIGEDAFSGCTGLSSLTIAKGVKTIGDNAFRDCSSLTSLTIPEGVTSIGGAAFEGCTGLTSVTISQGVASIGDNAFRDCTGLTSVTIAEGTTSIGSYAFSRCEKLTSITLPASLEKVGRDPFVGCSPTTLTAPFVPSEMDISKLSTVVVTDGVTTIKSGAFVSPRGGVLKLESLTIPLSVSVISEGAFGRYGNGSEVASIIAAGIPDGINRGKITSWIIPDGATYVGGFEYTSPFRAPNSNQKTSQLKLVTIPSSVKEIRKFAFTDLDALTSVNIPETVTQIGDAAFKNCYSLLTINFPSKLNTIGNSVFEECKSISSVVFPEGLTSIGDAAFKNCSNLLGTLLIPATLTTLGEYAFAGCDQVSLFEFCGLPPQGAGSPFGRHEHELICQNSNGLYHAEHSKAWKQVLVNGRWRYLKMTSNSKLGLFILIGAGAVLLLSSGIAGLLFVKKRKPVKTTVA